MKNLIVIGLLLLSLLASLGGCTKAQANREYLEQETAPDTAIPVRTVAIEPSETPIPIHSSGWVKAQNVTRLGFKVGGVIEQILVREGDWVQRGQALAKLQATEIDAQVRQAQSAMEQSARELQRVRAMYQDSVATRADLQRLQTAHDIAEANLEAATFNQKHTTVYAPAKGKILQRIAEPGEVVGPGTPILALNAKDHQSILVIGLTDRDIVKIRLGDKAVLQFDAFLNKEFQGSVLEIATLPDPTSGLFEVQVLLQRPEQKIRDGFFARAKILPSQQAAYYPIPFEAVVQGNPKQVTVYSPDGKGQARKLQARTYQILPQFVAVPVGELPPIKELITDGARYITDGSHISVQ